MDTRFFRHGAAVFAALFFWGLMQAASAQDVGSTKIGFVSFDRVFQESAPAKAARTKLESEFSKRQKDLQDTNARLKSGAEKFDRDAPVLSDSERARRQRELSDLDKDFQRRQREYSEDLNQRTNEERAGVIDRANKAIRQIAEAEKFDVVFPDALYVNPRIDITDKVLRALAGPAPATPTTK